MNGINYREGEKMDVNIGKMVLTDCDVDIILQRYTRRYFKEGREGDDMKDVGRMSYEFIIKGHINLDDFKLLNNQANRRNNKFGKC